MMKHSRKIEISCILVVTWTIMLGRHIHIGVGSMQSGLKVSKRFGYETINEEGKSIWFGIAYELLVLNTWYKN